MAIGQSLNELARKPLQQVADAGGPIDGLWELDASIMSDTLSAAAAGSSAFVDMDRVAGALAFRAQKFPNFWKAVGIAGVEAVAWRGSTSS
jgi:hypothetical protein